MGNRQPWVLPTAKFSGRYTAKSWWEYVGDEDSLFHANILRSSGTRRHGECKIMYSATPDKIVYAICGFMFGVPCLFFAWYTMRLLYLNLTMEDAAAHRSFGMLIGAIAFPLATIILGFISWWFIKKSWRGFSRNRER